MKQKGDLRAKRELSVFVFVSERFLFFNIIFPVDIIVKKVHGMFSILKCPRISNLTIQLGYFRLQRYKKFLTIKYPVSRTIICYLQALAKCVVCVVVRFFKKCSSTCMAKKRKYGFYLITAVLQNFGKNGLQHWILQKIFLDYIPLSILPCLTGNFWSQKSCFFLD